MLSQGIRRLLWPGDNGQQHDHPATADRDQTSIWLPGKICGQEPASDMWADDAPWICLQGSWGLRGRARWLFTVPRQTAWKGHPGEWGDEEFLHSLWHPPYSLSQEASAVNGERSSGGGGGWGGDNMEKERCEWWKHGKRKVWVVRTWKR